MDYNSQSPTPTGPSRGYGEQGYFTTCYKGDSSVNSWNGAATYGRHDGALFYVSSAKPETLGRPIGALIRVVFELWNTHMIGLLGIGVTCGMLGIY